VNSNSYSQTHSFQLLFQNTEDAVFVLDSETLDAIDCNKAALQLFGYDSVTEFNKNTLEKLIATEKLAQPFTYKNFLIDIKTSITFKKRYLTELTNRTKSGELFLGEMNISLIKETDFTALLCVIHDITEKKHSEMIQQFIFNLSFKDGLDEEEQARLVLEKVNEITDSEFSVFVNIEQEDDKFQVIAFEFKNGQKKALPTEISSSSMANVNPVILNCINNRRPERVNNFKSSESGVNDSKIRRMLFVPVIIGNKTKCFIGAFDKPTLYSKRDTDLLVQLIQNFWLVIQKRRVYLDSTKAKINLAKATGNIGSVERALKESQERYKKLISSMSDEVWVFDKEGKIFEANESACKNSKYSFDELKKLKFFDICPTVTDTEFSGLFEMIESQGKLELEGKFRRKDGSEYSFDLFATSLEMNGIKYALCTVRDMNYKKTSEDALHKSEMKYRTVVDQALEMIIMCGIDGIIIEANEIACTSLGYGQKELTRLNVRTILTNRTLSYLNEILGDSPTKKSFELTERVVRKDGSRLVGSIRAKIIEIDNSEFLLFTIRDIAEEMKREEKIRFLNFHDKVSGLYNKAFFEDELKRLDLGINLPMSIIMGDINGLKIINSTLGHAHGDKLINTIAYIILGCCRSEDIVARWGGDEFVVLLPNADEKTCDSICKTIEHVCKEYKEKNSDLDDIVDPSISFGYSTKTVESEDIQQVLKNAEDFMYKKKMLDKKSMHSSIVHSMRNTLFEKNFDNEEYSSRLNVICRKIGQALGLPDSELNELELLSILHDVGKIVIDAYVLNKNDTLTENDWIEIRKHPEVGYRIIKSAPELASVAEYVLSHHERWDGKGYPNGISGDSIPLKSKIIAVADAYAAMTQDKTYRKAMQVEQAKSELIKNKNTQFDEKVVDIFLGILEKDKSI